MGLFLPRAVQAVAVFSLRFFLDRGKSKLCACQARDMESRGTLRRTAITELFRTSESLGPVARRRTVVWLAGDRQR